MLGDVTEDLALRSGELVGGLVNATFGNLVELIISAVALTKKSDTMNEVAGLSNLGSILSNLLLVLGARRASSGCLWTCGCGCDAFVAVRADAQSASSPTNRPFTA